MTDQQLDRALASALDVEHGSDFQARVRMRVAEEPAPSPRLPWPTAAAAAAVVILAVSIWPRVERRAGGPAGLGGGWVHRRQQCQTHRAANRETGANGRRHTGTSGEPAQRPGRFAAGAADLSRRRQLGAPAGGQRRAGNRGGPVVVLGRAGATARGGRLGRAVARRRTADRDDRGGRWRTRMRTENPKRWLPTTVLSALLATTPAQAQEPKPAPAPGGTHARACSGTGTARRSQTRHARPAGAAGRAGGGQPLSGREARQQPAVLACRERQRPQRVQHPYGSASAGRRHAPRFGANTPVL